MQRLNLYHCVSGLSTLIVLLVVAAAPVRSQDNPYSDIEDREIKALSTEEIDQLLSGAGMGTALAAELNGYPGPRHVLDLQEELQLTDTQIEQVTHIYNDMSTSAVVLGKKIIAAETKLDSLFASRIITDESLSREVASLGDLYGELRFVHLQAHLTTTAVLGSQQRQMYDVLRGYSDHSGHDGHTDHH